MADYSLITRNAAGDIIIDGTNDDPNSTVYDTGVAAPPTSEFTLQLLNIYPDLLTTDQPFMAYRLNSNYYLKQAWFVISGGYFTECYVYKQGTHTGTEYFYWVCFRHSYTNALPTYGLIVRDASGNVIWHSADQYLKIVNVYTGTHTRSSGNTVDITVQDADNNYFCDISSLYCNYITHTYTGPWWARHEYHRMMKKQSSTSIRLNCYYRTYGAYSANYGTLVNWVNTYKVVELSF